MKKLNFDVILKKLNFEKAVFKILQVAFGLSAMLLLVAYFTLALFSQSDSFSFGNFIFNNHISSEINDVNTLAVFMILITPKIFLIAALYMGSRLFGLLSKGIYFAKANLNYLWFIIVF